MVLDLTVSERAGLITGIFAVNRFFMVTGIDLNTCFRRRRSCLRFPARDKSYCRIVTKSLPGP